MTLARAIATACATCLTSAALADCTDWGPDLAVCSTPDITVAYGEAGFPSAEIRTDTRVVQLFWTVAGERLENANDLEPFFWGLWGLLADRLAARGSINYGTDYAHTIDGRPVRGNVFTLRPATGHEMFFIRLEVTEAHGFPVAVEVIEPALGSDTDVTNALLARAISMIQPQETGQ